MIMLEEKKPSYETLTNKLNERDLWFMAEQDQVGHMRQDEQRMKGRAHEWGMHSQNHGARRQTNWGLPY